MQGSMIAASTVQSSAACQHMPWLEMKDCGGNIRYCSLCQSVLMVGVGGKLVPAGEEMHRLNEVEKERKRQETLRQQKGKPQ